jgi:hypothetical protein
MTTIACKDGLMACDSGWTDENGYFATSLTKIVELRSGALLGEAGDNDSRAVQALLQNVKSFAEMPSALQLAETKIDYAAVILFPDGEMAQVSVGRSSHGPSEFVGGAWPVNRGLTAVGSGAGVAIGAMLAGKSAAEAVTFACDADPNSKLPVHVYDIKNTKKKGRRKNA